MANLIFQNSSLAFWPFKLRMTLSAYDDGKIVFHRDRLIGKPIHVEMEASKVHFFIRSKSDIFGLYYLFFGWVNLYFGADAEAQATMKHVPKKEAQKLFDILCQAGAPFAQKGERFKTWNIKNPFSWFRKEYLFANDKGITYEHGTKEMAFIPYDEIKFFYDHTTLFTFGWDVFIYGKQFVVPKARVHGEFVKIVKQHLKDDLADQKSFNVRPGFFWRLFHPFAGRKPILLLLERYIAYLDDDMLLLPYSDVTSFDIEREHFYSWSGTVMIEGNLNSMRADQGGRDAYISRPNIGRCVWRRAKRILKDRT